MSGAWHGLWVVVHRLHSWRVDEDRSRQKVPPNEDPFDEALDKWLSNSKSRNCKCEFFNSEDQTI